MVFFCGVGASDIRVPQQYWMAHSGRRDCSRLGGVPPTRSGSVSSCWKAAWVIEWS